MMNNNFNNNGTNNNSNNNSNNGEKFIMANNTINSLQVFADVIKEAFSVTYPDAMVRVHEVNKNNGLVLTGLSICKKGTNLALTIYLDGFFKQYRMGRAVADILLFSTLNDAPFFTLNGTVSSQNQESVSLYLMLILQIKCASPK